jgi:ankyrin repeat protein
MTPKDRETLHDIARRGSGDLRGLLARYPPAEMAAELPAAAEIAATYGQDRVLAALFQFGLPITYAGPLLQIAVQHGRKLASIRLQFFCDLTHAIEALRRGDQEPALRVLARDTAHPLLGTDPLHGNPASYVRELLAVGLAPDSRLQGEPLLVYFARRGDAEMVRMLLAAGASPNARDARQQCALAVTRDFACAEALLGYGADPSQANLTGAFNGLVRTPVDPRLVELLLSRAPATDVVGLLNGLASTSADPRVVALLIARAPADELCARVCLPPVTGIHAPRLLGGDVVRVEGDHDRPVVRQLAAAGVPLSLDWACALGNLEAVQQCITRGADPRQRFACGLSPLQLAIGWTTPSEHRGDVVKLLLQHGADAGEEPTLTPTAGLIFRAGPPIPPLMPPLTYPTPLTLALERGATDIAELLLDVGARVRVEELNLVSRRLPAPLAERLLAQVPSGVAAAQFALRHDLAASFERIVASSAPDASQLDRWAREALAHDADGCLAVLADRTAEWVPLEHSLFHEALKRPSLRCAEWFLQRSPALATGKTEGGTPFLHVAIMTRHRGLVSTLLRLGAEPSMRNAQGQTAFDLRPFVHLIPVGYVDPDWPAWFAAEARRHHSFFRRFLR